MDLASLIVDTRQNISLSLTPSDYTDAQITIALNKWYREIAAWVIAASGPWEYRGGMPTTDLKAGQSEYLLPSNMVAITRVEIKYPNTTKFVKATRFDEFQTNSSIQDGEIDGAVEASPFFREFDSSIFIYPIPTADVTDGLAIEEIRDIQDLAQSTDTPDLNPLIEKTLSIGAAMDYCESEELYQKSARMERRLFGRALGDKSSLKYQIEQLAANRDKSSPPRFVAHITDYS